MKRLKPIYPLWFWDLQTGYIFPSPPNNESVIPHWMEEISRGQEAVLDWNNQNKTGRSSEIPIITYSIIAVNVIFYLLMTFAGGSTNSDVLIAFGAKDTTLILQGQAWRLMTYMFLHIGFLHLAINTYSLWILGRFTENLIHKRKFLILYLFCGTGAGISSFLFTPSISAGASGAIFGLLGALLIYSWNRPRLWHSGFGTNLLIIIGINLFLGFSLSGIDNFGHLGGLFSGILFALIFLRIKKHPHS